MQRHSHLLTPNSAVNGMHHTVNFTHKILLIPVSQRWLTYLPKQIQNLGRGKYKMFHVYEISNY